jgi:HlyD family type I secretion membrane fusion protein
MLSALSNLFRNKTPTQIKTKAVTSPSINGDVSNTAGNGGEILQRPSSNPNSIKLFGFVTIIAIFLGLGVWAGTAPLARSVAAPATLQVQGKRKKVQHLEGGIVSGVYVKEGQPVKEGQLLLKLEPLVAGAGFNRFRNKLNQGLALEARLKTELRDDAVITFEPELLSAAEKYPEVLGFIEAEQKQFIARRSAFLGQVAILEQRTDQLKKELAGLEILKQSRADQLTVFSEEIVGLRELYEQGYYPRSKVLAIERAMIELRGAYGSDEASIARTESAMGETARQIINVKYRFKEMVTDELKRIQSDISDIREQTIVAEDILTRIEINAPRSGIVQGLTVNTVGGVIGAGDVLMEIVPKNEKLIIEARIAPMDIDSLKIGQKAEIRLTALNLNTTPAIYGDVLAISGDSLRDTSTRQVYFLSRIEIPITEIEKLGDVALSAGMPADVLVNVANRTALDYFLKPLKNAFSRGLNEE